MSNIILELKNKALKYELSLHGSLNSGWDVELIVGGNETVPEVLSWKWFSLKPAAPSAVLLFEYGYLN